MFAGCFRVPLSLPQEWVARYNAVLSFHQLVENSDESFLLDNEAG